MKVSALTIFIFLFLSQSTLVQGQCAGELLNYGPYTCNTNQVLTPSSFSAFPANADKVVIDMTIKITSLCTTSAPFELFSVTINDAGTEKAISRTEMDASGKIQGYAQDTTQTYSYVQSVPASPVDYLNKWVRITFAVSFTDNVLIQAVDTAGNADTYQFVENLVWGTWRLGATSKIHICSKMDGTSSVTCEFSSFTITSFTPISFVDSLFMGGIVPKLIASYPLTDPAGQMYVKDITNGAKTYLGLTQGVSPDPQVPVLSGTTADGLKFTTNGQYLRIPTVLASGDNGNTFSFTLNFYFKPISNSNLGYVFRYLDEILNDEYITMKFDTNRYLTLTALPVGAGAKSSALTLNQWYMISAFVSFPASSGFRTTIAIFVDGVRKYDERQDYQGPTPSTAVIIFGGYPTQTSAGFRGSIRSLQIFTPGSLTLNNPTYCPSSSSACAMDLGFINPPMCLKCAAGSYIYQSKCGACPADTVAMGEFCLDCNGVIPHCNTCDMAASTCSVCKPGYYLASSTSCLPCSDSIADCVTCNPSGTTCNTCKSPKYLSSNQCVPTCPGGTCPISGSCSTCPACSTVVANCDTCNHADSTCSVCQPGYYLASPTSCLACSNLISDCATCNPSGTTCNTCKNSKFLSSNQCVPSCPSDTCDTAGVCLPCSSSGGTNNGGTNNGGTNNGGTNTGETGTEGTKVVEEAVTNTLDGGQIAGIVLGSIAFVALVTGSIFYCRFRIKKNRRTVMQVDKHVVGSTPLRSP